MRALFWEFFRISLFVLGGGYSIIVVADGVCARRGWIAEGELVDHLPVFQSIPGLIATHSAVYVGNKVAGRIGALVAVLAVALPSIIVFTAVSVGYRRIPLESPWLASLFVGLRASLAGIIAATVIRSWRRSLPDAFAYALMLGALAALALRLAPGAVIAAALVFGLVAEFAPRRPSGTPPARRFASVTIWPLLLFLGYGSLCFGGGMAVVPMYLRDFVGPDAAWLQVPYEEFSNIMALTQMTPGPIGVNAATFFGYRFAGVFGALAASALLLLPGSLGAYFAFRTLDAFRESWAVRGALRGARAVSVALMLAALFVFVGMSVRDAHGGWHALGGVLFVLATGAAMRYRSHVILIILASAAAGILLRA